MAQLPASMRRRKPATTSIHEKQPQLTDKLLGWGSWLLLFLACLVLIFGAYVLYQRMVQAKIAKVEVLGVSANERKILTNYVNDQTQGGYFTTDLEQIRDRALTLSWVDRVVVSRAWPDSVVLRVIPRHAIARWGTGRLLSDDGVVFQPVDPVATAKLPLLHGPQSQARMMMNKYRDINQMFAPMKIHLKELYLTERMTWFMQFDNGMRVIVDQDQTMSKLQRLSQIASSDLNTVWGQIAAIDLRYRNGLAIQWKDAQAPKIVDGHFVLTNSETAVATPATVTP
ncbi:FtsQ-type POTRA domain-containing protein [Acinetobacter qingfengensis]|uniref:Cell division protein FtsQ n=1 Tax=Acinetobacter qingfengensis TaxID=1262585 RepID=A0A1E7QWI4_9GAMM|nr:cell division protein FtsQ/DivIB [Acinetobacter qingfengensis]KAA8731285.1 FtsQ-type POTRA domain-containing protein [Acinetobacter qingfengensis]OEY91467.1 cell division protein FtsQ [Acinetobacter qingfengensis]